jgi:hypothetical protein
MLSWDGLLADLARQKQKDTPANRLNKFYFNLGLHRDSYILYANTYGEKLAN